MKSKKHIDDVQPSTVDEHFQLILDDRSIIGPEFSKVTPEDLPEWFNERLFKNGQKYYADNLLAFGTANLAGLIAIFAVPDILDVLQYTKRSSTVLASFKRFSETLLLMYALFNDDMLNPNSKWFKSMNSIRWRHAMVSKRRGKEGLNAIYQKDMAITEFGFIGYIFICPELIGLKHTTNEDLEGLNHFWRVTGHLLGIDDRINICRNTVAETKQLCQRIGHDILGKHMQQADPDFLSISSNSLRGMWYADLLINEDAFLYLTYHMTGVEYKKPLGWYSYLNMKQREWSLYMCSVPYIGWLVRRMYNYMIATSYWVLENCPVIAWMTFGKKNTQLCLYSSLQ